MEHAPVAVPPLVRAKAESFGEPGLAWLAGLDDLIAEMEQQWSITVGGPITGGTSSYVAHARTADGREAVLKLALPHFWAAHEIQRLEQAAGRGYARLLAADPGRNAMLMEALGPSMGQLGWAPEQVVTTVCATLRQAWEVELPGTVPAQTGASKARDLAGLIDRAWRGLDRPCSREVVDTALRYAERRAAAYREDRCVAVHGDPHAGNAMRVRSPRAGAASGFVFVDPEAFVAEPAYDLGVVLRDWTREFLQGSTRSLVRRRCGLLAEHSGLHGDAIWEWGFLERVATGLYVLEFGAAWGREHLEVAERLV
ncbi:aminoglycoside phosphotransferase family protein [Glycomyces niveus]|uniref:Phosphotransferase n=1 Tax=Glycomyces niveus TaxID=2820287 RepID=A0ABS3U8L2_9ACTN|nr:aminoglycoside phosphotransferase family protein [Glycomyces sp. NEAU-S30]MBO3735105.1 phosphotransferase [Glycomyces sp. NEAU-S30]